MKWFLLLLMSTSLMAAEKNPDQLAAEFYTQLISGTTTKHNEDQCYPRPDQGSCVKEICSRLSSWECDDQTEIQKVTRACTGNFGNACIVKACIPIPSFQRDDFNELSEISTACSNNYGSQCFDFFSSKLAHYSLDDRFEVVSVLNQCKGVSNEVLECTKYSCSKLGTFACDEAIEISAILRNCGR